MRSRPDEVHEEDAVSVTETASNKETFARLHEAFNSRDVELISKAIDEVVDPDVRIGTPLPVEATGAEALKQVWAILLRAYPDLHVAVEDVIAEGAKLVSRNTVTGTNQGEYMGRPPTGKPVAYHEIFIFEFDHGRVVETWGVVDVLSQLRLLGVVSL
jgi:predicted ester cyclase